MADAMVLALHYQMEKSQWLATEDIRRIQFRQLELLISHAARTVPFYPPRLRVLKGLRSGQLTEDHWRQIPLLRRAEIQEAREALVSRAFPKSHGQMHDVSTSGSTGRPVTVKATTITMLVFTTLNLRYHLWHRRDPSAKVARITVAGASASQTGNNDGTSWFPAHESGPFVAIPIATPVSEQLAWLKRENPGYLLTYPSNLMSLVKRSTEARVRFKGLRGVATMGEVLSPEVRVACEDKWGVPVTDGYSAQEVGFVALQCPDQPHCLHVQSESALVEVLDDHDEPCAPGQVGRVVVTGLHNFATPLIRYEIGDYAEVGRPCPCGRGLPVLHRVLGRSRNMLTLPSGDQVWPQWNSDDLTARVPPVRQVQLIQHSLKDIEVKLAVARMLTADEEQTLGAAILERLYHPFPLRFTYVNEIGRSAGGKYEDFSSRLAV